MTAPLGSVRTPSAPTEPAAVVQVVPASASTETGPGGPCCPVAPVGPRTFHRSACSSALQEPPAAGTRSAPDVVLLQALITSSASNAAPRARGSGREREGCDEEDGGAQPPPFSRHLPLPG